MSTRRYWIGITLVVIIINNFLLQVATGHDGRLSHLALALAAVSVGLMRLRIKITRSQIQRRR